MNDHVDPWTGEIVKSPVDLVALDLAKLNEDELIALMPTPVQAAGALLHARDAVRRAPAPCLPSSEEYP